MRILHFILGKANPDRANGVNQVVYGLATHTVLLGHKVHVVGISQSMKTHSEIIQRGVFEVEAFQSFNQGGFDRVKELARQCDIVHLHGVWNFQNVRIGKFCRDRQIPYVVTAHGAYMENYINQGHKYLKVISNFLFQKRLFENAIGVHTLTREESTAISRYCGNAKPFVIPNGIDIDTAGKERWNPHDNRNKIKLGYLGRLSKEKNLENLIYAFYFLPENLRHGVELDLIGPSDGYYGRYLSDVVRELGLTDTVKFIGPKYGKDKIESLIDLDIYIHPSLAEGFSIALIECLFLGIPMIVTRTSNLTYYYNTNSFLMAETTSGDLCRAIVEMIDRREEWSNFSERARSLVLEKLSWRQITIELLEKYADLLDHK